MLEIAEKHPVGRPRYRFSPTTLHSYFCKPIFVPSEQPSGLKLLPLAKLDSNRVTTNENRLYWTQDSKWKVLFLCSVLYLGIRSETRRSEFFSTKMKLVSIDHRADDNGFPSLSAVQISRRIQHRRILRNFANRAKLERRVSNGYRFWAMWRKVGKESWERRLVIGR